MTDELKAALFGLWTLACLTGGWLLSDHWHKPVPVVATAHAQADLGGGNVLAAREVPKPDVQLQTAMPEGDKPVAMAHVQIAARKPTAPASAPPMPAGCEHYVSELTCPAVSVDETLVKDKTGQLDLVVKGDGGAIVDQASITPLQTPLVVPAHPWAVGGAYDTGRRYGVFVDRDAGPWRLGLEIDQAQGTGLEARVRVGWRF